ncbi:S8 family serine peptidase [Thermomonospora cellulosilytica]|uniref:Peptidase S8/S53 domain-containing protein n=1 Tax=Thermomonospora cellulosilytica TaxID=1411118 RepID=A0A7W3N4R6_9ACTN|nr:S8 family serine peptidase [Thermomonospora cellulosilytica]MBA9007539.1 hypothetical protein [Thermomonospora cellulosilytica]
MLTRICASFLAVALTAALTVADPAPARADESWARQLGRDLGLARQVTKGDGVTVAVLSTGVDRNLPWLRGRVEKEKDFVGTDHPTRTLGTVLASLVAGDHESPFIRLASGARVLPVRILPDGEEPDAEKWWEDSDLAKVFADGIRYAADQGAQVIVMPVALMTPDSPYVEGYSRDLGVLSDAVTHARAKNAVVVASNVHVGDVPPRYFPYPASSPGVIAVNGLNEQGERHPAYSKRSGAVLVSAPATEIGVPGPSDLVYDLGGDPVAVSWVAAAVAFVKAKYPDLTPDQVARALAASARHPKGEGTYDTEIGYGIVNPDGALKEAAKLAAQGKPVLVAKDGAVPEDEHFGGGRPDPIGAARHPVAAMAGFPALMLAGVAALAGAFWLWRRPRPAEPVEGEGAGESADAAGA